MVKKKSNSKKSSKKKTVTKKTMKKQIVTKKPSRKKVKKKPVKQSAKKLPVTPIGKPDYMNVKSHKCKGSCDYLSLVISLILSALVGIIIFFALGTMDEMMKIGISVVSFIVVLIASYLVLKE